MTEGSGIQFKLKFKRLSLKNWPNNGPKTGTFSSKRNINMSSRYAYAGCKKSPRVLARVTSFKRL